MVTFIDDYSRYVWAYFMKEKSEIFGIFKLSKREVERDIGRKICCLRFDNEREYMSQEFLDFFRENKIRRQLTCPKTPQEAAERTNWHLVETC